MITKQVLLCRDLGPVCSAFSGVVSLWNMSTEHCLFLTTVSFNFLCLNGFSKVHFADLSVNQGIRMDWGQWWGWSYSTFRIRTVRSSASLLTSILTVCGLMTMGFRPGCQLAMTLRNKWALTAVPVTLPPFWCLWPGPVSFTQIDCGGRRWNQDMRLCPTSLVSDSPLCLSLPYASYVWVLSVCFSSE